MVNQENPIHKTLPPGPIIEWPMAVEWSGAVSGVELSLAKHEILNHEFPIGITLLSDKTRSSGVLNQETDPFKTNGVFSLSGSSSSISGLLAIMGNQIVSL